MGLDQYAYAGFTDQRKKYFDQDGEYDRDTSEWIPGGTVSKPKELAYWRKHPNLQGWMEKLWIEKGKPNGGCGQEEEWGSEFNGVELELTWADVDCLEKDIKSGVLSKLNTTGFFFGEPSDNRYREQDLQFCIDAKTEIFLGFKVFYNSSW